nr:methyltransferase domain-containing protein [Roseomonas acroporae]
MAQLHRHWLTLEAVRRHLPHDGFLVDLGSYPFGIPIALRDFCLHRGRIAASAIQPLPPEQSALLRGYGIEHFAADLDPHVVDETTRGLECRIPCPDGAADLVLLAHVVEHLYHPLDILREALRALRPGGMLVVTTQNARQVDTFDNLAAGHPFLHQPVASSSAMVMGHWRGPVRFFTAEDMETMLRAAGFDVAATEFAHCFYHAFLPGHFARPEPALAGWKLDIVVPHPQFRNTLTVFAQRPA